MVGERQSKISRLQPRYTQIWAQYYPRDLTVSYRLLFNDRPTGIHYVIAMAYRRRSTFRRPRIYRRRAPIRRRTVRF